MDKRICAPFMHELKVVLQRQAVDICASTVISRLRDTSFPNKAANPIGYGQSRSSILETTIAKRYTISYLEQYRQALVSWREAVGPHVA